MVGCVDRAALFFAKRVVALNGGSYAANIAPFAPSTYCYTPAVNVAVAMITPRDDGQRGGLRGPRCAVLRQARGGAERRLLGRRRAPSRSGASDSTTRGAVLCRQLPLPHGLHIDCISLLAQLCFGNCAILEQSITADPG